VNALTARQAQRECLGGALPAGRDDAFGRQSLRFVPLIPVVGTKVILVACCRNITAFPA